MIECKGIHHVSLVVTDLERARRFYGEVLTLTELDRPDLGFPGLWFQIGDQQLHLLLHPPAQTVREGGIDTRDGHFAIRVGDYRQALAWLKQQGVEVVERPDSRSGFAQIFCTDPDGNVIELNCERTER